MTSRDGRILIVDDDISLAEALEGLFENEGYQVSLAANSGEALEKINRESISLTLLDVRLGNENGLDLLPRLKILRPEMTVIVITAAGTVETAVQAMQLGADNFIVKPLDPPRLLAIVSKGLEVCKLRRKASRLERLSQHSPSAMLGESPSILQAFKMVEAVADRDTTVLLLGETGTGKGMLARRIHELSSRRLEPFVELNCAGLNRELTESELFGHERGAFTGAMEKKIGLFEATDGGTLLLDEIGEMDPLIQTKLLQVIEKKRFRRVGGTTELTVDVRVLAATHRDLEAEVENGRFRRDLFFRLNVFAIRLPRLSERRDDILPLALHFFNEFHGGHKHNVILSDTAASQLLSYEWPGNIRELRNVMERAEILCPPGSPILPDHLPPLTVDQIICSEELAAESQDSAPIPKLEQMEQHLIVQALTIHQGNIQAAARDLGISRGTLYRKAEKYGISLDERK